MQTLDLNGGQFNYHRNEITLTGMKFNVKSSVFFSTACTKHSSYSHVYKRIFQCQKKREKLGRKIANEF